MPKENIYRDVAFWRNEPVDGEDQSPASGTAAITTLRVSWDEARGIEIVVGYEERPATRVSADHEVVLGAEPPIDSPTLRYIHVYPDRRQSNQLVRALRRARNEVFGADE